MNIDIAKPCTHIRQMDRYYVSILVQSHWRVIDRSTSLPVYDSTEDGQDKPLLFDDWDDAHDACDHLNSQKP